MIDKAVWAWNNADTFSKVWFGVLMPTMMLTILWFGVSAIRAINHQETRTCQVDLASGATVDRIGCTVGYRSGALYCDGVSYGPGAWLAVRCDP